MQSQSSHMLERKAKTKRLLSIFESIINNNPEFINYVSLIIDTIKRIEKEELILLTVDYKKVIMEFEKKKELIDVEIEKLRKQASKSSFEDVIKKIGLIEKSFSSINEFDLYEKVKELKRRRSEYKKKLKRLSSLENDEGINSFNVNLNELYLKQDISTKYLDEDRNIPGLKLTFNPYGMCLLVSTNKYDKSTGIIPGSMARQTHLQILVYLNMFQLLEDKFQGLGYLPLLIMDSINQPMGIEVFQHSTP